MVWVVKKFGGTSVGNVERIKRVAKIVSDSNEKTIIVVSAMAGVTNELVAYTKDVHTISKSDEISEYDTVVSAGEQITVGLVALALNGLGLKARSYLGWQVPINTSEEFSRAKIIQIQIDNIMRDLDDGVIPVVAGFQGVHNGRITTLGRGGSDTTAVALAVAVNASRCDIYTDVDGVFTADPRIVTKARKINEIDYESVLEMASCGAKVIHPRAVEIAMKNKLDVRVLNTFSNDSGTKITKRNHMEETIITGIATKRDLVMVTLLKMENSYISNIFEEILKAGIIVESVNQSNLSFAEESKVVCDYTLIFGSEFLERVVKLLQGYHQLAIREKLTKISIIGIGVKNDGSVLNKVIDTVKNIELIGMQVLETQISLLIEQVFADQVVRNLHSELGLDTKSFEG
jgi:aspartate kinase